jgi:hypothetical protein
MKPSLEHKNLIRSIPINYLVFSIFYSFCIIFAVLLGITLGFLPEFSLWFGFSFASLIHYANNLFIVLLPLSLVLVLNSVQFSWILSKKAAPSRPPVHKILLSVVTALPLLYLTVYVYHLLGLIIAWPIVRVIQSIVVAGSLMTYALIVTVIMSNDAVAYLIRSLRNHELWIIALAVGALLVLPTLALINPITKGYFHFFPSYEQYFPLADLFLRGILLGILIPLLPLALHYIDSISTDKL